MEFDTSMSHGRKSKDTSTTAFLHDPLRKLNPNETSEFVKSLPTPNGTNKTTVTPLEMEFRAGFLHVRRSIDHQQESRRSCFEAPCTPGRPVFNFGANVVDQQEVVSELRANRRTFPSKWDDAEKWLISSHESPSHPIMRQSSLSYNGFSKFQEFDHKQVHHVLAEKSRVAQQKVVSSFPLHHNAISSAPADTLLKDSYEFGDEVEPVSSNFNQSGPSTEGFLFRNTTNEAMKDTGTDTSPHEVKHRDVGTDMTPLGSSTTSRCHTPFKSLSPARHNTPAKPSPPGNSGSTIDMSQLQKCNLDKLQFGGQFDSVTSNWSSKEEEEEEISKSLRHSESGLPCQKSMLESRAIAWEDDEKTKCCLMYQREEAKIQAWVNLQNAKAEAQSRKLEVKIQKMRSRLDEKLMKRMADVNKRAEEWRASAQQQHADQMQKATEQAQRIAMTRQSSHFSKHTSCGCFPCNNH